MKLVLWTRKSTANPRKPTNTYTKCIHTPPHVFKAFIYGETLRYTRNTNNEDDFLVKVKDFSERLMARSCNLPEINKITHKVSHNDRSNMIHKWENKPKNKTPLVFTTTYNPCINHGDLNQAINKHWPLIQCNETLSRIFPNPPFIAYKKDQNIREKLIRAKLNQSPIDSSSQQLDHIPNDSGFVDAPVDALDILISLLDEEVTT